ncbi:MAG: CubicO group peptidase (beta-lactamase class C family) [Myxococcota bacterium]|jgi:CubicO group peptidase (beta-lactamase class C family)
MSDSWSAVTALLEEGVSEGLFPGGAVCVRDAGEERFVAAVGQAELAPNPRSVTLSTPWDLASITKVLGTTPLAMRFVGQGLLDLDAPIADRIPDAPAGVTAAHCLSHTSGLPPWRALFETLSDQATWGSPEVRSEGLRLARTMPVTAPPGERYAYSDLGFMLLCALLEHIGGERLDALWHREVGEHCGADLRWGWPTAAATEDCPVRGRVIVGEVHDLNTAVLGGVSSHAGLFGPVQAVAAAAAWQLRAFQGADEGLQPEVVRRFWTQKAAGSHRLGFDSPTPGVTSAGPRWPLDGVGHTGFTGGCLWVAPRQGIVAALCTNRVHPVVEGGSVPGATGPKTIAFRRFRPRLFTAVVDALYAEGRWS